MLYKVKYVAVKSYRCTKNSRMRTSGCYYCANTVYFVLPIHAFLSVYYDVCTIITSGHPDERITAAAQLIINRVLFYLLCIILFRCKSCGGEPKTKPGDCEWVCWTKQGVEEGKKYRQESWVLAVHSSTSGTLSVRLWSLWQKGTKWVRQKCGSSFSGLHEWPWGEHGLPLQWW